MLHKTDRPVTTKFQRFAPIWPAVAPGRRGGVNLSAASLRLRHSGQPRSQCRAGARLPGLTDQTDQSDPTDPTCPTDPTRPTRPTRPARPNRQPRVTGTYLTTFQVEARNRSKSAKVSTSVRVLMFG